MNKNVKQLCCVCSGSGEHDAFGRIPVNVHANPNEFRFWRETIAEMIADVSGVYVSRNKAFQISSLTQMRVELFFFFFSFKPIPYNIFQIDNQR